MKATMLQKITAGIILLGVVLTSGFVYADEDQQSYDEAKTRINTIKNPSSVGFPTAPSGRDQKGSVVNVLSRLFNSTGKIRSIFIAAFQNLSIGYVPSWTGTGFTNSIIQQTGSTVNIQGDFNIEGEIYKNDVLFKGGIWTEGTDEIYYNSGSVGVGVASPDSTLHVGGDIKVGSSADTCDASKAGAIRFNAGNIELCANY